MNSDNRIEQVGTKYSADHLYNVSEMAEYLGVSNSTAWRIIHQREIEIHKIRGSVRISQEQINSYLERTILPVIDASKLARIILNNNK